MGKMIEELWIYQGLRLNTKDEPCWCFGPFRPDTHRDPPDTTWYFRKKGAALSGAVIGGIYAIPAERRSGGAIQCLISKASYVEKYDDTEAVATWEAEDEITRVAVRRRKAAKDARLQAALAEGLAPLRRLYQRTDALGRATIEALVLRELRRII